MELKIIEHGTTDYQQMVNLRLRMLRIPLGLTFSTEQLEAEKKDILICAYENKVLAGTCVLTQVDKNVLQLRQMAVEDQDQGKGIGKKILEFAENIARERGYKTLMMHARDIAVGFYEKCGYSKKGEPFTEVTIPHYQMEKKL